MAMDQKHGHARSQAPIGLCILARWTYGSTEAGTHCSSHVVREKLLRREQLESCAPLAKARRSRAAAPCFCGDCPPGEPIIPASPDAAKEIESLFVVSEEPSDLLPWVAHEGWLLDPPKAEKIMRELLVRSIFKETH